MSLDPTHSEEIERLVLLESDAERRYSEAVDRCDQVGAADAAQDWKKACEELDALLEYPRATLVAAGSGLGATHESAG